MPRLPIKVPRAGLVMIFPAGVTRFCKGINFPTALFRLEYQMNCAIVRISNEKTLKLLLTAVDHDMLRLDFFALIP